MLFPVVSIAIRVVFGVGTNHIADTVSDKDSSERDGCQAIVFYREQRT